MTLELDMSETNVAVFPDSNLFLHYRPLAEFDWLAILQANAVEINIAMIVAKELDEIKVIHPSKKIRERASTAVKTLHEYLEQASPRRIRDGVTLDFVSNEMTAQEAAPLNLNFQLADDRFIGTILRFKEEHRDKRCVLVTADLGLKMKASQFRIEAIRPNDNLKLPTEQDPAEKRIRELEQQVAEYASRSPSIDLRFSDGQKQQNFKLTEPKGDVGTIVKSMVEEIKQKYPIINSKPVVEKPEVVLDSSNPVALLNEQMRAMQASIAASVANYFQVPDAEYNRELLSFYSDYKEYLEKKFVLADFAARTIVISVAVGNSGTLPAEDVHLSLHFPDGTTVYKRDGLPKKLKEPKPPARNTVRDIRAPLLNYPDFYRTPSISVGIDPNEPKIRKTNSYEVTFESKKLQHQFVWNCAALYVVFDSWVDVKSFSIDYSLHAGNVMKDREGKLHVVIEKV
jgi:hypothetical protein